MNWTGGTLQRHSHKTQKSLQRAQKEHFAKTRLKARNTTPTFRGYGGRAVGEPSTERTLSTSRRRDSGLHDARPPAVTTQGYQNLGKRRSSAGNESSYFSRYNRRGGEGLGHYEYRFGKPKVRPEERDGSLLPTTGTGEGTELEDIRRDLLRQRDWTSLSITRPVRINFDSHERGNLGRRRRLTEEDEQRQAVRNEKRVFPTELFRRPTKRKRKDGASSTRPTIDDISINIGAPEIHARSQRSNSHGLAASQQSSQSMLLDNEEEFHGTTIPVYQHIPWITQDFSRMPTSITVQRGEWLGHEADSGNRTSVSQISPESSSLPTTHPYQPFTSPSSFMRPAPKFSSSTTSRNIAEGFLGSTTRSISASTPSCVAETPVRRQFTLDKQIELYEKQSKLPESESFCGMPQPYNLMRNEENGEQPMNPYTGSDRQINCPATECFIGNVPISSHMEHRSLPSLHKVECQIWTPANADRSGNKSPKISTSEYLQADAGNHEANKANRQTRASPIQGAEPAIQQPPKFFGQIIEQSMKGPSDRDDLWKRFILGSQIGDGDVFTETAIDTNRSKNHDEIVTDESSLGRQWYAHPGSATRAISDLSPCSRELESLGMGSMENHADESVIDGSISYLDPLSGDTSMLRKNEATTLANLSAGYSHGEIL